MSNANLVTKAQPPPAMKKLLNKSVQDGDVAYLKGKADAPNIALQDLQAKHIVVDKSN